MRVPYFNPSPPIARARTAGSFPISCQCTGTMSGLGFDPLVAPSVLTTKPSVLLPSTTVATLVTARLPAPGAGLTQAGANAAAEVQNQLTTALITFYGPQRNKQKGYTIPKLGETEMVFESESPWHKVVQATLAELWAKQNEAAVVQALSGLINWVANRFAMSLNEVRTLSAIAIQKEGALFDPGLDALTVWDKDKAQALVMLNQLKAVDWTAGTSTPKVTGPGPLNSLLQSLQSGTTGGGQTLLPPEIAAVLEPASFGGYTYTRVKHEYRGSVTLMMSNKYVGTIATKQIGMKLPLLVVQAAATGTQKLSDYIAAQESAGSAVLIGELFGDGIAIADPSALPWIAENKGVAAVLFEPKGGWQLAGGLDVVGPVEPSSSRNTALIVGAGVLGLGALAALAWTARKRKAAAQSR